MAKFGPKPLPLRDRLLSKIRTAAGNPLFVHPLPLEDWPESFRKEDWVWVGAKIKRYGVFGGSYRNTFWMRPERPSFKLNGGSVQNVHVLVYKEFFGEPQGTLRYHRKPVNYLDVNPAHWRVPEQAVDLDLGPAPKPTIDPDIAWLAQHLDQRFAAGRPLVRDPAAFTLAQWNEALALAGLHRFIEPEGGSYVPQDGSSLEAPDPVPVLGPRLVTPA